MHRREIALLAHCTPVMLTFKSAAVGNSVLLAGVAALLAISTAANAAPIQTTAPTIQAVPSGLMAVR